MNYIFVYIANPNKTTAKKVARKLLQQKLIACANIFPIDSMYWWREGIVMEGEFVLIGKTENRHFSVIKKATKAIHPYKIPCITKISVKPNPKYQKWLAEQLRKP